MRLTIIGFAKLIPKITSFLFVASVVFGYFAVVLVKLYKDDMYECLNYAPGATINSESDCYNWGGDWVQMPINFANFGNAMLYLFLVAATEGWSFMMLPAASLRGAGLQPILKHNPWMQFLFLLFFYLGNMIIVNIFIGLSIYNFKKIK